jgi:hypothetical protein
MRAVGRPRDADQHHVVAAFGICLQGVSRKTVIESARAGVDRLAAERRFPVIG